jgi:competence protein ComEC
LSEALRLSGLAHLLAISGLHMSLVAGGIFWFVRALLALSPAIALRVSIKQIAAACGLAAAGWYLLISGQSIATQRAFIMLAVMFCAVLLGRSAISLRNLSLAALVVVALSPHAVSTASFQMSFLAVAGLIGCYEGLQRFKPHLQDFLHRGSPMRRPVARLLLAMLAIGLTTIIAGLFTALPAAYHFNRFAAWSLPANLVAMPAMTLVVMPAAVASVVLMPLSLEHWPLQLMKLGLEIVEWAAVTVSNWPGASVVVGDLTRGPTFLAGLGLVWLAVWRGHLRWAGLVVVVLGLGLARAGAPFPDIYVERTAATVAVRNSAGELVPVSATRGKFAAGRWLLADGDSASLQMAAARRGWQCSDGVCRADVRGKSVIWLDRGSEPPMDCRKADIVL